MFGFTNNLQVCTHSSLYNNRQLSAPRMTSLSTSLGQARKFQFCESTACLLELEKEEKKFCMRKSFAKIFGKAESQMT